MHFSRGVDYAIRAVACLAGLPPGAVATRLEVSRQTNVSEAFLAKILRRLVTARLVRSQPGVGGGFALAKPSTSITLLQIVEVIDGSDFRGRCMLHPGPCGQGAECGLHRALSGARAEMLEILRTTSISDLARRDGLKLEAQ
jgi:Rrf2 family iron-sulfur cluster assembly transcriptional regulator